MHSFVSIKEIAQLLNCSAKTVRRKIRKGIIPAIQPDGPGTLLRFEVEEVLRAVRERSVTELEPGLMASVKNEEPPVTKSKGKKLSGSIPKWKQLLNKQNKET